MKYAAFAFLCGVLCSAAEVAKPVCDARSQGQLWPEEANSSRDARQQLYESGELEMCSLVVWKYKWEHISVNVRDLGKSKHSQISKSEKAGGYESR
jgi:hypothetical protein